MNNKLNFALLIILFVAGGMSAQGLEDDPNIIYMKANVLFDSGRYDEAVKMYNRVLNQDEAFAQAYVMRAKTKYALGAYKGTKKDIMEFIEQFGITKDVIKLMSKTELKLENYEAARNYVDVSQELDPYDAEQHSISGSIHFGMKAKSEACECWSHAASLGHTRSQDLLEDNCGVYLSMQDQRKRNESTRPSRTQETRVEDNDRRNETSTPELPERMDRPSDIGLPSRTNPVETNNQEPPKDEVDKDAYQEIEIDEFLTIVFSNGLGKRKVDEQPDIFLIADKSGRVVVDLCIDSKGKVASAELNKDQSTIIRGGIISLALRKANEFTFFPSFRDEQCGSMVFVIKAED